MSEQYQMTEHELVQAWATPILTLRFANADSLNAKLATIILQKEREFLGTGSQRSFPQLWNKFSQLHVDQKLLLWGYEEIRVLRELITAACERYIQNVTDEDVKIVRLEAWANVSRKADWHGLHSHHAGGTETVSGVYWVRTPMINNEEGNELNGHTIYYDPRGSFFPGRRKHVITPREGAMILHPSWLAHSVAPVKDECERISVAFDAHANFIIS